MGPRVGLDEYGKPRPRLDTIPGPSSPYRVDVPTELSRPAFQTQPINLLVIFHFTCQDLIFAVESLGVEIKYFSDKKFQLSVRSSHRLFVQRNLMSVRVRNSKSAS